ncbi:hypothetical protein [Rhizobium leguminosarum]|uniref:hypothetical protein n=1 Tax=Rhizobium leguminosarum TaxID=384 RepID=UPI003D072EC8
MTVFTAIPKSEEACVLAGVDRRILRCLGRCAFCKKPDSDSRNGECYTFQARDQRGLKVNLSARISDLFQDILDIALGNFGIAFGFL